METQLRTTLLGWKYCCSSCDCVWPLWCVSRVDGRAANGCTVLHSAACNRLSGAACVTAVCFQSVGHKCVSAVCHTLAIWPILTAAPTAALTLDLRVIRVSLLAPPLGHIERTVDMHRHRLVVAVVTLTYLGYFALYGRSTGISSGEAADLHIWESVLGCNRER